MITFIKNKRTTLGYRILSAFIAFTFIFGIVIPPQVTYAQLIPATILNLPTPGTLLPVSSGYTPALITGLTVYPENPLEFDFMIDIGDSELAGDQLEDESQKLIKYFLASLTVPEDELWVNLSPYERDRIIPKAFGETEMGRDLLAQDYLLKQLTASLMYPEDELGKKFWDRVYKKAYDLYGTTEIPMNTFNKVWIVPDQALVFEKDSSAYVIDSHLKVMLEEDYVALKSNLANTKFSMDRVLEEDAEVISGIASEVVREILIPEIEREVNEGETFANLRQIYNSMILATWYKQNLKESLLGQVYVDQNKTKGVDVEDKQVKQKIYGQYLDAFKKGVYNYIREDYDPIAQEIIPRKYFSGGFDGNKIGAALASLGMDGISSFSKNPDLFVSFLVKVNGISGDEFNDSILPEWNKLSSNDRDYILGRVTIKSDIKTHVVNVILVENAKKGSKGITVKKPAGKASSPVQLEESERTAITITAEDFVELVALRQDGKVGFHKNVDARPVVPAPDSAVLNWNDIEENEKQRLQEKQAKMYGEGKIAPIVMAGGEATRFGGPKTFVKVSDDLGDFLEIKAANLRWLHETFGTDVPLYLLSSEKRLTEFKKALEERANYGMKQGDFRWYVQGTVDTFIPTDEEIEANFTGADIEKYKAYAEAIRAKNPDGIYRFQGEERKVPPGHFDAVTSFIISGRFSEALARGVEIVPIFNIDNLQAVLKNDGSIAHFAEQNKDFAFMLAEKNITYSITHKETKHVDKLIVRFREDVISFDGIAEFKGEVEKDGVLFQINQENKTIDVIDISSGQTIETVQVVEAETGGTLVQPVDASGNAIGKPTMKEGFELQSNFDHVNAPYFNTNTVIVRLRSLLKFMEVTEEELRDMSFEQRSALVREKLVKQIKPNFEFKKHTVEGEYPDLGLVKDGKTQIPVSQVTRIMLQVAHIKGVEVEYYNFQRRDVFAPVKKPEDKRVAAANNRKSLKRVTKYPQTSSPVVMDIRMGKVRMNAIVDAFTEDMEKGLRGEESSLPMLDSHLKNATGQEQGEYVAVDWGGSNLRVMLVELNPGEDLVVKKTVKMEFDENLKTGSRDALFGAVAEKIGELGLDTSKNYSLGFTFSFPMNQTRVDSGELIKWMKGWNVDGVVGENVVALLQNSLDDNGMENVRIRAVLNDTVGTQLTVPGATAGVILGTGHNISIYNPETETLINMESGGFNKAPMTIYDREIFENQRPYNDHAFEKMVSGLYLGEVVRLRLLDLHRQGKFMAGQDGSFLKVEGSFETRLISVIEEFNGLSAMQAIESTIEFMRAEFEKELLWANARIVLQTSREVSVRAGRLMAAAFVAVVKRADPEISRNHIIGIDGSVYAKHPNMDQYIKEGMALLVGKEKAGKIELRVTKDGSGIGAAIAAAVAEGQVEKTASLPVGGIDLNPELLDLQIKRDGNGIPLPLYQQPIYNMKIEGFFPVIINITPVVNTTPLLLGLVDEETGSDDLSFVPALEPMRKIDRFTLKDQVEVGILS